MHRELYTVQSTTLVHRASGDSPKEIADSDSSCGDLGEEGSQHKVEDEVWRRKNVVHYHMVLTTAIAVSPCVTLCDQNAYVTHELFSQIVQSIR
jgi:hypothetical protein